MQINFTTNERNEIALKNSSEVNEYANKFTKSEQTKIRKFNPPYNQRQITK
jgi:hypothetical protein